MGGDIIFFEAKTQKNDSGEIGNRIRDQREKLGISQDELSKRLGYKSRSSINKIELGERNLTQAKIKSIADALGTTPEYIMGWTEQKSFKYDDIINSSEENTRIFEFVEKALSTQGGFKAFFLSSLSQMTEEEWESFEAVWKKFCKHE